MSLTLEEAVATYGQYAQDAKNKKLNETFKYYEQLAEWLRILKKAKFEYDEAWRILTHPTPDVRYPDINKAKMILDMFGNSLGLLDAERRTDG